MRFTILLLFLGLVAAEITRGINWFGFETDALVFHMLWCKPLGWHLDRLAEVGFNAVRVPISEDFVMQHMEGGGLPKEGAVRGDFPEAGVSSVDILDRFFRGTAERNISVILDMHRLTYYSQAYKPFVEGDPKYTFERFLDAWTRVLQRYAKHANLLAVDIFNEYQGSDTEYWFSLAETTINHIENLFPGRFAFYVEGTNWGAQLGGAAARPLRLSEEVMNRTTLSVHKYWFLDADIVEDREALTHSWDQSFGYLREQVSVGEWGYMSEDAKQKNWATWFVNYLISNKVRNSFFWSYNFDSDDTEGVLKGDCDTLDQDKVDLLHHYWNGAA